MFLQEVLSFQKNSSPSPSKKNFNTTFILLHPYEREAPGQQRQRPRSGRDVPGSEFHFPACKNFSVFLPHKADALSHHLEHTDLYVSLLLLNEGLGNSA